MKKVLLGFFAVLLLVPQGVLAEDCSYCVELLGCMLGLCEADLGTAWRTGGNAARFANDCIQYLETTHGGGASTCRGELDGSYSSAYDKIGAGEWKSMLLTWGKGNNYQNSYEQLCMSNVTFCCADCASGCSGETGWVAAATGYQKNTKKSCECGTCVETTAYRCAAGYYGSSSNGTSGCTKCPVPGTSVAGTTTKNGCYVSSGTDAGGAYSYTSMCYYSN